jgi:hypothetical protein
MYKGVLTFIDILYQLCGMSSLIVLQRIQFVLFDERIEGLGLCFFQILLKVSSGRSQMIQLIIYFSETFFKSCELVLCFSVILFERFHLPFIF